MEKHKKIEEELLGIIALYYGSEKKALAWYDKPHIYLGGDDRKTPRQKVESGDGEAVLKWVKMVLDK